MESLKWFKLVLFLLLIKNRFFFFTWIFSIWINFIKVWFLFIRLNNGFVFSDLEPPIMYDQKYVWMIRNMWPILIMFFYVFFCYIIKVNHFLYRFIILLHSISSLSLNEFLLISYAYVSIKSNGCILLSSFELNAILLVSSVKT